MKKRSFIETLCGAYNEAEYKVIRFLGVKMKFRSETLAIKKKMDNIEREMTRTSEQFTSALQVNEKLNAILKSDNEIKQDVQQIENKLAENKQDFSKLFDAINSQLKKLEDNQKYLLGRVHQLSKQCLSADTDYTVDDFQKFPQLRAFMDCVIDMYRTPSDTCEKGECRNRVIVNMTSQTVKTGLVDRIRTMCTAYVLAAEAGMPFHIYHDAGFTLQNYLIPNEVNWLIDSSEVKYDLDKANLLFYLRRFRKLDKQGKDYHIYQSQILVDYMLPESLKGKYTDHSVFRKLFNFHPNVVQEADTKLAEIGCKNGEYVSLHCRFLNFFQQIEVFGKVTSTPEQREKMVKAVHATAEKIHKETGKPIILFSDSDAFLQKEHPSFIRVLKGAPGHIIMNSGNDEVTMKAFVDLLIMSRGSAVYSLRGDNLYASGYSRCAAVAIGGIPFICEPIQQI